MADYLNAVNTVYEILIILGICFIIFLLTHAGKKFKMWLRES